jgi:hypothetical protein
MSRFRLSDVLELSVSERLKLVWAIWDSIAEAPETLQLTEDERAELDRRLRVAISHLFRQRGGRERR